MDLTYIQDYLVFLDLKIIIKTIRVLSIKEYAEGIAVEDAKSAAKEKQKEKI